MKKYSVLRLEKVLESEQNFHSSLFSSTVDGLCFLFIQSSLLFLSLRLFLIHAPPTLRVASFLTAQCGMQFSPRGVRPSCSLMTARHLDQNTMGYLQWRWGPNSAMTTSLVRDTKTSHFTLALQVHTHTHTLNFTISHTNTFLH